jgi:hypothetical protein
MFKKFQYVYLLKKYITWGFRRVAVCPSYIYDVRFLKVKLLRFKYGSSHFSCLLQVTEIKMNGITERQVQCVRKVAVRL